jgi:hypothetical protein
VEPILPVFPQAIFIIAGPDDNVTADTAITAIRSAKRYELLPVESDHAVTAFTGFNPYLSSVKHIYSE